MSIGFHYYETVNQSLSLQYFSKKEAPVIIAKLKSYGAITNIAIGGVLLLLTKFLSYQVTFSHLGMAVILLVFATFLFNPTREGLPVQHRKMIFRKKYWLFYTLTFLSGARRQLFVVFSVFLMVERFKLSVSEIAALFVINNFINFFLMPYVGKAINYFGEKKVLMVEYISLIPIFLAYALVDNHYVVMIIYIFDHIVYNFAIALRTFFQKIADPKDIAPSMAVSFTINHIAAVFIPALGGALWIIDYRIPFLMGVALALFSLWFSFFIPQKDKKSCTFV
jgi:predicted MFS family arabinose efflux permease